MNIEDAQRRIAEAVAQAAYIDPAAFPPAKRGTPADDAWADLVDQMKASTQAMSEEIIEAGVKLVFPPLDLD